MPIIKRTGTLALVLTMLMVLLALPGQGAERKLTVGIIWGPTGAESAGFVPAAEAFQAIYPDVEVEFLWTTSLGDFVSDAATAKVINMIVGGLPPDIVMVSGQNVPQYAVEGFLHPIDRYVQADGLNPQDFVPPAWSQTFWDGRQYAMTLQVDPNFALVWNKDIFSQSGLDPERGPETLAEWEDYFRTLTRIDGEGIVTQIAQRPWDVYGSANTTFTWGWVFGGAFYDYENQRVTAADPRNVEAVEFIRDYHQRYNASLGGDISFPGGNEAMRFAVTSNLLQWRTNFPDIPLGAGFEPYKADTGSPNPSWIGGWAMAILEESQNKDLAWEFLKFITASEEGTYAFAKPSGWIPAYLRSPIMADFMEDPHLSVYLQIAQSARFVRPAMPVISTYMTELGSALDQVLQGTVQPADALRFVEQIVQQEQDRVLAR